MSADRQEEFPKHGRVIETYRSAFPDPIVLKTGEEVIMGRRDADWPGWIWCTGSRGKSGWVPETYLKHEAGRAIMRRDYDGSELTVAVGEVLQVHWVERGWAWCMKGDGEKGWVPLSHL